MRALKSGDTTGVLALRDAIQANRKQHTAEAIKFATAAASRFRNDRNFAGELRARYEEVYANQRSMNGGACLKQADDLEQSLRLTPYHELLSELLLEKAVCEKRAGRPGEIDSNLNESGRLAREFGFQALQLRVLGLAAGFKKEAGLCKDAWFLTSKGISLYWQGPYPAERLYQFYEVAAECAERQHHWHSAETLRRRAIVIRESMGGNDRQDAIMLGTLYLDLATILIAQRKDSLAAEAASHADSILKPEATEPTTQKFRSTVLVQLAKLQLESGNEALALSTLRPILELARKTGDHVTTLQCYGVLGDIYLKSRNTEEAIEAYQTGIAFSENALATLSKSDERLAWTSAAGGVYRGLVRAWLWQKRDADAWRLWEWYKGRPLKIEKKMDSPVPRSWAEIQTAILKPVEKDSPLPRVTYASFADGLQIWVNQGGSIISHWKSIQQHALEEKAQDFYEDCLDSSSELSQLWKRGEELYSMIWQPIAAELPASGLIVAELDSPFQNVSLEALRTPAHKYLAEQYTIVYSPGKEMDRLSGPTLKVEKTTRMLVLDASVVDGIEPIQSQQREVQFIARQFVSSRVLNGADATRDDVRNELRKSDIFFFAGHAIHHGNGSELLINPSFLAKATDFRPQELSRLRLAVLAACSTGDTDRNGFWDTQSLINAFLATGVANVVASRWDVESDSTSDLMQHFAVQLLKGRSPATALFVARREVIAKLEHPYYWAGFYVAGQPN